MNIVDSARPGPSLREQLIHALVKDTKRTRCVHVFAGHDMAQGVTCPDCAPPKTLLLESAIGPLVPGRKVKLEYFKEGKYSVWVGHCTHCDLLVYVMRLDRDIVN